MVRLFIEPIQRYTAVFLLSDVLYIVGIKLLVDFMKKREPFNIRGILVVWNVILSGLSGIDRENRKWKMEFAIMVHKS